MLGADGWKAIAEVNPPELPDMSHLLLDNVWRHVLITDNVFGRIRLSPYAYAARITHDVPSVNPTVVVSTRDRNILAIESEVRGALGNGVRSFLVVVGDTMPRVEHMAHHYEIVEHLRELREHLPRFEVGMPTRFREWQFRRRIDVGAQYFVAGPVLDPATIAPNMERLRLTADDPPVYCMVVPPFSPAWVERNVDIGAEPITPALQKRLAACPKEGRRELGWQVSLEAAEAARDAGCSGVVLMGLRFRTVVDEAAGVWRPASGVSTDRETGGQSHHHHP